MNDADRAAVAAVAASRDTFTLAQTVARALAQRPVGSPCTNVCRLDADTRSYCLGCHRSRVEIKEWKTLDDTAKLAIIDALPERLRQRGD